MRSGPIISDGFEDRAAMILGQARKRGIELWSDNGILRCKAPKGVLSEDDVCSLQAHRAQLIESLEMRIGIEPKECDLVALPCPDKIPLTFSQLFHWKRYQLATRRHMRQIAFATELDGSLDISVLRDSVANVVSRHEALRTRILTVNGAPYQKVLASNGSTLEIDELASSKKVLASDERGCWIWNQLSEEIDVCRDPLFSIRLVKESHNKHVLLLAMEHIIADGVSGHTVLKEILTAYAQAAQGDAVELPDIQLQFTHYALWQQSSEHKWIAKRSAYWQQRLALCQHVYFPQEGRVEEGRRGWGTVRVQIQDKTKTALALMSRRQGTTLVISVLSAYVALLMRWCSMTEFVIQYVTDGRIIPRLQNTVGYIAFDLCLRIRASKRATFTELMSLIGEEYLTAQEHTDLGYADAHASERDSVRTAAFNWVWQGAEIEASIFSKSTDPLKCSAVSFEHPVLDTLDLQKIALVLYERRNDIVGGLHYPRAHFSDASMKRFTTNFLRFVEILASEPHAYFQDVPLV